MDTQKLKVIGISYVLLFIGLVTLYSFTFSSLGSLPFTSSSSTEKPEQSPQERVLETGYQTAEEPVSVNAIFEEVNRYREKRGLPTLRFEHELAAVAAEKTAAIINNPDSSDHSVNSYPALASQSQQLDYPNAEQLVTYSSLDTEGIADYLLTTQPYKKRLLDPDVTHIGLSLEYTDALSPDLQKALVVGYIATGQ